MSVEGRKRQHKRLVIVFAAVLVLVQERFQSFEVQYLVISSLAHLLDGLRPR